MVVSFNRFGRLGNRLFLASHLIAFSERTGVPLRLYFLSEYRNRFPFFSDDPACRYPPAQSSTLHFCSLFAVRTGAFLGAVPVVRFWEDRDVVFDGDDENDPRVRLMTHARTVVFEGWRFRSRRTIVETADRLRQIFAPTERVRKVVESRISAARSRGDLVIGVHVRWEDYRGTQRFFPMDSYRQVMEDIEGLFRPRKVFFLVCSQEPIDKTELPGNCVFCSEPQEPEITDLYTLAGCDYIVGPISTFSGWASLYGERPLFVMKPEERLTSLEQATIVRG